MTRDRRSNDRRIVLLLATLVLFGMGLALVAGPAAAEKHGNETNATAMGSAASHTDTDGEMVHTLGGEPTPGNLRVFVNNGLPRTQRYTDGSWQRQFYTNGGLALNLSGEHVSLGYYNDDNSSDPTNGWAYDGSAYNGPVEQTKSGNSVTTVWNVRNLRVEQTISYTNGSQFYRYDWRITNNGGFTYRDAEFFRGVDTYLSDGDSGNGFWNATSNTVGVSKEVDGTRQQLVFQGITDPTGYRSAFYDTIINDVLSGNLNDSARTDFHDNGYALQWTEPSLEPGETWDVSAVESFTTSVLSVESPGTVQLNGDTETLTYQVNNIGSQSLQAAFTVDCPSGFSCTQPAPVTIAAGGSVDVSVTVDPPAGVDAGTYPIGLTASAPGATPAQGIGQVEVPIGTEFRIDSLSAPDSNGLDSPASVTARVTNAGVESGTRNVSISTDGETLVERELTLSGGESQLLTAQVSSDTTGSVTVTVDTGDETDSATIEFVNEDFVCGVSTGDPHFVTFDGTAYDFQGAGEYVLVDSADRTIQARHVPVGSSISSTTAVATRVDGQTVEIDVRDRQMLTVDGSARSLSPGQTTSVGDGEVRRRAGKYVVIYPGDDGAVDASDERMEVSVFGDRLDIEVCLLNDRTEPVEGLLGNINGVVSDDIALDDGTVPTQPRSFDVLYGPFRDDWRVTDAESLFSYDQGNSTDSYYVENFPRSIVTVEDLNQTARDRAERLAREAGLEPGTPAFRNAVVDIALTGQSNYLDSAARTEQEINGRTARIVADPGQIEGQAGETTQIGIAADSFSGTLDSYDVSATLADSSVASIVRADTAGTTTDRSTVTDTSARVVATDVGSNPSDDRTTLVTLTVRFEAAGQTELNVSAAELTDAAGNAYEFGEGGDSDTATVTTEPSDSGNDGGYTYRVPYTLNEQTLPSAWHSNLVIGAQNNGTSVSVDVDADGQFENTTTIDAGQSIGFAEPTAGAVVETSAPASVRYDYGSADFGAYEDGRLAYGVPHESVLGTTYAVPIEADTVAVAATAATDIRLDTDGDGSHEQTRTATAGGVVTFENVSPGTLIRADEPIHVVAQRSNWDGMDDTMAVSLLPESAASRTYQTPAEPSYSREAPTSQTAIHLAAVTSTTDVDVDLGQSGTNDTQVTLSPGETATVQTTQAATIRASAPVVAVYSYHVVADDPWTGDRRDYVGSLTPVSSTEIRQGSWSSTSESVKAWSTYNITVENDTEEPAPNGRNISVTPVDTRTSPGATTSLDVVMEAPDGVLGQQYVLSLSDTSVAAFTSADVAGDQSFGGATVENDTTVTVEAGYTDALSRSSNLTLATVTVEGVEPGTATLSVENIRITDRNNDDYTVGATQNATVSVDQGVILPGETEPAASTDSDPLLEDVNGDGSADVFDALTYYQARNSAEIQNNPRLFDFDGNGRPGTLFDALELYEEIS